ncbi:exopolysaccharide biosynthesis protein [Primorskyibacter aestuariivivens]|uniref:exopolysaccharide biosynthesis protein n=1 Tax=Primorskyibacter aestuariivivens TaxID=1888912 RepID=UPI0023009B4B|nr:exopolysaccharide biosynthesis protein [Primorskyibacter aestuariivivens]MDA7427748.1 exopolysaccharide biosynthesis protein [Primorskyibacter aestuariivivens]
MTEPRTLGELLDAIEPGDNTVDISLGEILDKIGGRSFAPVILVPALLMISPLSAIPGMPTLSGLLIILITLQWVFARNHMWLPGVLLRRRVAASKVSRAASWLRKPTGWVDRHSHRRLRVLTTPPLTLVPKLSILLIASSWPILELLPMVTSIGAFAVALLAFGMMTRDGAYLAAGYAAIGLVAGLIIWLTGLA